MYQVQGLQRDSESFKKQLPNIRPVSIKELHLHTRLQTSLYTAQNQNAQLIKPVSVPKYSKKYMLFNGIVLGAVGFAAGALLALAAIMILIILKGAPFSRLMRSMANSALGPSRVSQTKRVIGTQPPIIPWPDSGTCFAGKDNAVIGVVGSASDKDMELLTSKLNDKAGKGLKFKKISDFMKDANAYRSIGDTDGVILTAEIGKTDFLLARKGGCPDRGERERAPWHCLFLNK